MIATINREIHGIVVKTRRFPRKFAMTLGTIRWETCTLVVRILRIIKITLVAGNTFRWCACTGCRVLAGGAEGLGTERGWLCCF